MGDGSTSSRRTSPALRILILDDDALAAMAFAAALSDQGHEIVAITDTASEGIAAAEHSRADLALVAIGLADGRTGLSAAQTLRDVFTIPTVLVSGEPELARKAKSVSAIGYIAKPVDADEVARTVSRVALLRAAS